MADFETELLPLIRDEIGDGSPPSDVELEDLFASVGYWRLVALRILKRRRAEAVAAAGGGVSNVSIPGAISVGLRAGDVASLDRQIAKLENEHAAELAGEPVVAVGRSSRIHRTARWR